MNKTSPVNYRSDIQGLRAVAIILVVLSHAGIFFSGGYIGVDVFFVLSGYLITGLLIGEYSQTNRIKFCTFISRRLKRLLPSLLIMIIVVLTITPFLISNFEFLQQTMSSRYASTWTSNLYFSLSTINYFSELQTRDLFLHTWSLSVEEQFYLIWPVLLLFLLKFSSSKENATYLNSKFIALLVIVFSSSLALSFYWATTNPLWVFYMMPSRIWQFTIGAGVFIWLNNLPIHKQSSDVTSKIQNNFLGVSGICLIIGSAVLLTPKMHYTSYSSIAASLGTAFIIIAGYKNSSSLINILLSNPVMVWIGNLSYSIYLWHWSILILGFSLGLKDTISEVFTLLLFTILISILNYRFIELPFWKGSLSRSSTSKSILLSILVMLLSIMFIQKQSELLNDQDSTIKNLNQHSLKNVLTSRTDIPVIYSKNCDSWYSSSDIVPCVFGNNTASQTVVLLGDSIGVQWFSFLPEIFSEPDWRIIVLTKSSCPMIDEDIYNKRLGKNFDVCITWRNSVLDYLLSIKPSLIILGSSVNYNYTKQQWVDGSSRLYKKLSEFTENIIVIAGTPKLSFDGPSCLMNVNESMSTKGIISNECGEKIVSSLTYDISDYLNIATDRFSNVALLDLNELVCPNKFCRAQNAEGLIVYRDQQHLTDTFVRKNISAIKDKISELELDITLH